MKSLCARRWAIVALILTAMLPLQLRAAKPDDAKVSQRVFNQAIANYASRAEACRSTRVIRREHLRFSYAETELREVLAYFSARRFYECVMRDMGETLAAGLWLAGHAEQEMASKTLASLELVWAPYADYARSLARFERLPEGTRRAAEAEVAFQQPFDLIQSAQALGL